MLPKTKKDPNLALLTIYSNARKTSPYCGHVICYQQQHAVEYAPSNALPHNCTPTGRMFSALQPFSPRATMSVASFTLVVYYRCRDVEKKGVLDTVAIVFGRGGSRHALIYTNRKPGWHSRRSAFFNRIALVATPPFLPRYAFWMQHARCSARSTYNESDANDVTPQYPTCM